MFITVKLGILAIAHLLVDALVFSRYNLFYINDRFKNEVLFLSPTGRRPCPTARRRTNCASFGARSRDHMATVVALGQSSGTTSPLRPWDVVFVLCSTHLVFRSTLFRFNLMYSLVHDLFVAAK